MVKNVEDAEAVAMSMEYVNSSDVSRSDQGVYVACLLIHTAARSNIYFILSVIR